MMPVMDEILEGHQVAGDRQESVDVVVIGSGCGGATLAKDLAGSGLSVLILERGGYYSAARGDLDQRGDDMLARIDGGRGLDTTRNAQIALMHGNCVGGASVHYWGDSWRLPDDRARRYAELGVEGHDSETLRPFFEQIERDLSIHPTPPDYYNRMNQLFDIGARKLGWHVEPVPQARKGCAKSGHCYQGCSYDAKQSQLVTHIPAALKLGARLFADCRVDAITRDEQGRANGITASFMDRHTGRPSAHTLRVKARAVVLAAGGGWFGGAVAAFQATQWQRAGGEKFVSEPLSPPPCGVS